MNGKPQLLGLLAGLFLAAGLVFSAMLVTRAWLKISETQTISVTGSIASQGDRGINQLRNARMGVFQITPLYSTETAWDGMNDTTSLEKTVTAVVSATFSLK